MSAAIINKSNDDAAITSLTGKLWSLPQSLSALQQTQVSRLANEFNISTVVADLMVRRGITDSEAARLLLHPSFADLHSPLLMHGMREAVARILRAVEGQEKILIYGDYDVDGTTGTVVMRRALELIGAKNTGYHIPHRFTEGYGINTQALAQAHKDGYTLIISVDCGIRAHEPLAWARANNLDCIVTDHHLPDETKGAPPAVAVLNPNQTLCAYPDKHLAGVGVAFKLAHALLQAKGKDNLAHGFLKLVALGTVADMASLVGENRAIVKLGLADLPNATNFGLRALMEVAGCCRDDGKPLAVDATDIGFRLAPRINAAGRMDAARQVVELFEAEDAERAHALAAKLDGFNRERQSVQREIVNRAIEEMEAFENLASHVAVIAGDAWHRGVLGLAASKIAERYNRPSVVVSFDEDDNGHGSARSCGDYHLLNGLESCADLFVQFGGHAAAAGLAIHRDNISSLRQRLNAHAAAHFNFVAPVARISIDRELAANEINLSLLENLKQLEPFGAAWRKPVFMTKGLRVISEPRVMKERHLKIYCAGTGGARLEAVWWGGAETLNHAHAATIERADEIELCYTLEANDWQGERRLQMNVSDAR